MYYNVKSTAARITELRNLAGYTREIAASKLGILWLKKDELTSVEKQSLISQSIHQKLKLCSLFLTCMPTKDTVLSVFPITCSTRALLGVLVPTFPTQPLTAFSRMSCIQASLKMVLPVLSQSKNCESFPMISLTVLSR